MGFGTTPARVGALQLGVIHRCHRGLTCELAAWVCNTGSRTIAPGVGGADGEGGAETQTRVAA